MTTDSRPNILFVVVDDCGYADLSCCGQTDYATPALDRLASEGVRFTQAYANAPLCTNTRVAIMDRPVSVNSLDGLSSCQTHRISRLSRWVSLPPSSG